MTERGVIRRREQSTQVNDFSGLKFGSVTPTDIDGLIVPVGIQGCIEWKNDCYVLYEFKHRSNPIPLPGQRLAIERLCNDLLSPAIALLCVHNTPTNEDIDCGKTIVVREYFSGRWTKPAKGTTARQSTERFLKKYGGLKT